MTAGSANLLRICFALATCSACVSFEDAPKGKEPGYDLSDTDPNCTGDPSKTVIDGAFSPHEWECGAPLRGTISNLYLRLEGGALHLLIDWFARTKKPLQAKEFYELRLATAGGKQSYLVRAFGDGHIEAELYGVTVQVGTGKSGFGPSPGHPQAHAIFEALLSGNGATFGAGVATASLSGPAADCPSDGECSQKESAPLAADLGADGSVSAQEAKGPLLIAVTSGSPQAGGVVTVAAAQLGDKKGAVAAKNVGYLKVVGWAGESVSFIAPSMPGTLRVTAHTAAGAVSNELSFDTIPLNADADCGAGSNGRPCDDGSLCTAGDACKAGACVGMAINCGASMGCTENSCAPASGCVQSIAIGKPCNDGLQCTGPDECDATGFCHGAVQAGKSCNDGQACTDADACDANGTCTGKPQACDDNNPCTTETCIAGQGCVASAASPAPPCDDGNACTSGDNCVGVICLGSGAPPPKLEPCHAALCDPKTGATSVVPQTGTACEDGNGCTVQDFCVQGQCKSGPVQCADALPCTTDSCDLAALACVHVNMPDGATCTDQDACTYDEKCAAGACKGKALVCDDGDPKTQDSCLPSSGCVFWK